MPGASSAMGPWKLAWDMDVVGRLDVLFLGAVQRLERVLRTRFTPW